MTVTYNGKKLQGEATTSQRVTLHFLTGKDTRNIKLSKAEASNRISKLMARKPSKTTKSAKLTGEATVSQKVYLHFLTGKDTRSLKISKAEASARIAKLARK